MGKNKIGLFDAVVGVLLIILCFIMIYPFVYALAYSFSDGSLVMTQNVTIIPVGFTLDNYKAVFANNAIITAALISVSRTVLGTFLFLAVTGLCAYSMSKKHMIGKKYIFIFFIIPMYVSGGLLPYYILIHDLKLMDNFLVYIIPGCYSTFFMLLLKVYFETIPDSLEESAKLDGAIDAVVFLRIYLPLSLPAFATVALFVGVSQWNSWFDAQLFVRNTSLYPLQLLLQNVLKENDVKNYMDLFQSSLGKKSAVSTETMRMAILMVTTLPIIFIYPFAQKYFVKGVTLGAVKL